MTSEFGIIRRGDGRTYQITAEDVLWLARATACEGGSHAANLWTFVRRFAVNADMRGSLADMVRRFSQPVSPAWDDPEDPACQRYPERCTPEVLARRERCRTARFSELGEPAWTTIRFVRAEVPNPVPRANNFADLQVGAEFLRHHPSATIVAIIGGMMYIAEEVSRRLPADYVTIEYRGRVAGAVGGSSYLWWVIGAGVVAGIVWWAWRSWPWLPFRP
jgi:hypothetical protein